ncbi:MAG TPA: hypothetical protein PLV92_14480 [Pirellulaceae bacterium]|nr:hypothetical protein [Pirellulaceae bacterium]
MIPEAKIGADHLTSKSNSGDFGCGGNCDKDDACNHLGDDDRDQAL